jgi:NTP pyrophosphatase (non-canonical NTP hydrolase)
MNSCRPLYLWVTSDKYELLLAGSYGCPGKSLKEEKAMNEEMKMTQEREGRILEAAIDTWGSEMQIIVAIEEMSELTKALTKYIRADDAATIVTNIREEMADVGIMLNQLSLIFGDTTEEEIRKLNRLRRRIEDVTGETLF